LNCNPILAIELKIRPAPKRTPGGAYSYRSRIQVVLASYALNAQKLVVVCGGIERDVLIERGALTEVVSVVGGNAAGALREIVERTEGLIAGSPKEEREPDDLNPFTALFSLGKAKALSGCSDSFHSVLCFPRRRGESIVGRRSTNFIRLYAYEQAVASNPVGGFLRCGRCHGARVQPSAAHHVRSSAARSRRFGTCHRIIDAVRWNGCVRSEVPRTDRRSQ